MSDTDQSRRQWFLRLQSAYVLPLARGIYLMIALGCLLAMIGGILFAVYLQALIANPPSTVPVPPPYRGSVPTVQLPAAKVDLALVGARLDPPTNIRFVVTAATINEPVREGAVLGHFLADTPNQLAPLPDGLSLIGGRDAELFERRLDQATGAIGLAARAALAAEIGNTLRDIKAESTRTFEIRVVARDRYGITSAPTDLSFALTFGPAAAAIAAPASTAPPAPTELQATAREIAQIIEPEVNPAQFSAYQTAVKVPERCGTKDADQTFVANYRRALEEIRPRLTKANVEAFYAGLCEAWKGVLEREAQAREDAQQEQWAAQRAAEEERSMAQAHNNEVLQTYEARVFAAKAQTTVAMSVIGGALAIFLSVSLVLAFLAIEGHSRAVRAAMESMVRMSEGRQAHASESGNP